MEFRLIYRGSLHGAGRGDTRAPEKHRIRKEFHVQLAELWKQNPLLREQLEKPVIRYKTPPNLVSYPGPGVEIVEPAPHGYTALSKPWVQHLAEMYQRFGYRFVPLVREQYGTTCSLEILFLRRDNPGSLVSSGGDIDNRIKVLLDALRMPGNESEVAGYPPADTENPFFCLLEDDKLITGISVTTDRLLLLRADDEKEHDVFLVILVKTKALNPNALFADAHIV